MSKYRILFFFLFNSIIYSGAAQSARLDSLLKLWEQAQDNAAKVDTLNNIAIHYSHLGYLNTNGLIAAKEALNASKKIGYAQGTIVACLNLATYYEYKGNNEEALDNSLMALDVAEKTNDKTKLVEVYSQLVGFYSENMKNYPKALEYSKKGMDLFNETGLKTKALSRLLTNTGNIYYDMANDTLALKNYMQALDIAILTKDNDAQPNIENNIGSVYTDLKEYDKAIDYYQRALAIYQDMKSLQGISLSYLNIGNALNMKGETKQGTEQTLQALSLARQIKDKNLVASSYSYLSDGYSRMGDYQKAYEYQTALCNIKDTLFSEASSKQVNDMQVKYDTEKKDRENKILELSINRQRIISYAIATGLLLVILLVFFVYRGYVNKKKAHEELAGKNKIIEEKNKDILDSINYAKTIQSAILTQDDYLKDALDEYFILYKPRDVVSGDFYWCHTEGDKVVFTVADCTGHGVPGAFMSMIGNSLLNEVVIEKKITDAAEILNSLRANLLKTLQQKGNNNIKRDGMDLALCVWDKKRNTLQFAGANNPLYLARNAVNDVFEQNERIKIYNNKLVELLPDKQPIGYYENKTENPFSSVTINVKKGDVIYVSTDGYVDQFGGELSKKYTRKRFRETLESVCGKSLSEQKEALGKNLETWKGSVAQTDDICILGVQLS